MILGGILIGIVLAEVTLAVAGLPRFHQAHGTTARFSIFDTPDHGHFFWLNKPDSDIVFTYDSDPRNAFDPGNEMHHRTNRMGFRGSLCDQPAPRGTVRIAFLGDSFTFGEGVRQKDIYPQMVADLLSEEPGKFEVQSCNYAVGGYNSADALFVLRQFALPAEPDAVVLGYVLNDAEPRLYRRDPTTGRIVRRPREAEVPEGKGDPTPPRTWLYKLRTARLIWKVRRNRERTDAMLNYYLDLYAEDAPGWVASKAALTELIGECRSRQIPCVVVCFPILVSLDQEYPFTDVHERVRKVVGSAGGTFVDLLDELRGMNAPELWVHPTDQHPNEIVHRIAAEAVADALREAGIGSGSAVESPGSATP